MPIGLIIAAMVAAAAAKTYSAHKQDQQNAANQNYNKSRDALSDKRQAAQDAIAEQERKRQTILAILQRSQQQRQAAASLWHPSMASPQQQPMQQQTGV